MDWLQCCCSPKTNEISEASHVVRLSDAFSGNDQEIRPSNLTKNGQFGIGAGSASSCNDPSTLAFEVMLRMDCELGAGLDDLHEDFLIVTEIGSGALQNWNTTCRPPNQVVKPHDHIMLVNRAGGSSSNLMSRIESSEGQMLCLTIHRPKRVELLLQTPGELGIGVSCLPTSTSVMIEGMSAGRILDWNNQHPDKQILPYDRIVSVNGSQGNSRDIVQHLKHAAKSDRMSLTILCYFDR
eukprot:TRINITY_DN54968_c0_g1_i1.p1 TRINITY_DN54968_c0_g1~~TRINITY_DN54968_c0_g1_i1.p1  ORF type:complete len:239 (+),score=28.73 TRINITY_DN54968_c0_g1_i1:75-791(+)